MARNPKPMRRQEKRAARGWARLMRSLAHPHCDHRIVVESKRYEDGSIDGKCVRCGEDGFPIRDVAWEEFQRTEGVCCGFGEVWP